MRLEAASVDVPPGLDEFLLELGDGEHGFSGTDFGNGEATLADFLHRVVDMAAGRFLSRSHVPMTTFWFRDDADRIVGTGRYLFRHPKGLDASLYGEAGLISSHEAQHAGWIRRWRSEKGV